MTQRDRLAAALRHALPDGEVSYRFGDPYRTTEPIFVRIEYEKVADALLARGVRVGLFCESSCACGGKSIAGECVNLDKRGNDKSCDVCGDELRDWSPALDREADR